MAEHFNFFEHLRGAYGQNIHLAFKDYWKYNEKLASMMVRKDFLIKCRQYELIPTHIIQRVKCVYSLFGDRSPYTAEMAKVIKRFQRNILSLEIKHTIHEISDTTRRMNDTKNIMLTVPPELCNQFLLKQDKKLKEMKKEHKKNCDDKFHRLLEGQLKLP